MKGNGRINKLKNIKEKLTRAEMLLTNSSIIRARSELLNRLGKSFGGKRDIYEALGYKKNLDFDDFYARYKRQDIAACVINRPVKDSWVVHPKVSEGSDKDETEFEKGWLDLVKQRKIYYYLSRLDKLCGIGRFALLLIGVDDGKPLSEPLSTAENLIYLQTYKEGDVQIQTWERDSANPRYGLPVLYTVSVSSPDHKGTTSQLVHYTRVIHVTDNCLDNDVFGESRLADIYNRLQDLELVVGSSAEMFYIGAFQGLAFILDKDAQLDPEQGEAQLEEEIQSYIHKFQRTLKLQGMDVKALGGTIADPRGNVDVILDLIAGTKEIPKRILIGSERGELASSQDADNWWNKIQERQTNFCEPIILRPLIDRLIETGILPSPQEEYRIEWPNRSAPSEDQKAIISQNKINTLTTYVNSLGADQVIPVEIFLEKYMGLTKEEIDEIQIILGSSFDDLREEDKLAQEEGKLALEQKSKVF